MWRRQMLDFGAAEQKGPNSTKCTCCRHPVEPQMPIATSQYVPSLQPWKVLALQSFFGQQSQWHQPPQTKVGKQAQHCLSTGKGRQQRRRQDIQC